MLPPFRGGGDTRLCEHLLKKMIGEGVDYDLQRQPDCDCSCSSRQFKIIPSCRLYGKADTTVRKELHNHSMNDRVEWHSAK